MVLQNFSPKRRLSLSSSSPVFQRRTWMPFRRTSLKLKILRSTSSQGPTPQCHGIGVDKFLRWRIWCSKHFFNMYRSTSLRMRVKIQVGSKRDFSQPKSLLLEWSWYCQCSYQPSPSVSYLRTSSFFSWSVSQLLFLVHWKSWVTPIKCLRLGMHNTIRTRSLLSNASHGYVMGPSWFAWRKVASDSYTKKGHLPCWLRWTHMLTPWWPY